MDQETAAEVRKQLDGLEAEIKIVFFKENLLCATCGPAEDFLKEVAALSGKLKLEIYNQVTDTEKAKEYGVTLTPAAIIEGPKGRRVRFYGIPAGYEFVSLLESIKNSAAPAVELLPDTLAALAAVAAPVTIKVFVTPGCPYCPGAVVLAHKFALASPNITAEMIEAGEFQSLAQKYGVEGVPRTFVNDKIDLVGLQPEQNLLKAVQDAVKGGTA